MRQWWRRGSARSRATRSIYYCETEYRNFHLIPFHCLIRGSNLTFHQGLVFEKIIVKQSDLIFKSGSKINEYDWQDPKVFRVLSRIFISKGFKCQMKGSDLVISGDGKISKKDIDDGMRQSYRWYLMLGGLILVGGLAATFGVHLMAQSLGGYYLQSLGLLLATTLIFSIGFFKIAYDCQSLKINTKPLQEYVLSSDLNEGVIRRPRAALSSCRREAGRAFSIR